MIPKKIHYCWFGGRPLPDELLTYMESWKKFCPNYEFKIWNEGNFDVNSHLFTKSAYEAGRFAFVSDYVRAYALLTEGGVYLDTDVELKQNIDIFLTHEAFSGFELRGLPITAVWGAIKNHSLSRRMIDYYHDKKFTQEQEPNTKTITNILIEEYGIKADCNELQIGSDSINTIHIYPAEYFCLDIKQNYATHHFSGSWIENKNLPAKKYINMQHLANELISFDMDRIYILNALAKRMSVFDILKTLALRCIYKIKNISG